MQQTNLKPSSSTFSVCAISPRPIAITTGIIILETPQRKEKKKKKKLPTIVKMSHSRRSGPCIQNDNRKSMPGCVQVPFSLAAGEIDDVTRRRFLFVSYIPANQSSNCTRTTIHTSRPRKPKHINVFRKVYQFVKANDLVCFFRHFLKRRFSIRTIQPAGQENIIS